MKKKLLSLSLLIISFLSSYAQQDCEFDILAFYTAKNDLAHISFVNEANERFKAMDDSSSFCYSATNNWDDLNEKTLNNYRIVMFLDTRPEKPEQRKAFENYMQNGGAWMGFHFSAFALNQSAYSNDWEWYHDEFLGSGEYGSNTWRPTSAILKVEKKKHPVVKGLGKTFKSQPNEWYRWEHDLRENKNIEILLSIDPSSFPLGTGPKAHEIWHSGYYPVVWTNKKYNMVYFNMGHNDMDYEGGTNATLSHSFDNKDQNQLLLNSIDWLAKKSKK